MWQMVKTNQIFHEKYWSFTSKLTDSKSSNPSLFSYVRMIQNHPPTPVRKSKYSYLFIKRVYQLSIQGDIFEKKIKHVGKQST